MIDRDEIDILWQQAMNQAVKDGEPFTRYDFAALVAAAEHKACLEIADLCADADMHASMAANAIRARSNT